MLSRSPNRYKFQRDAYTDRCKEEGKEPSESYLKMFDDDIVRKANLEEDPEWQKNNLEYDLRSADWILEKVRSDDVYAQNLYAALCNNDFQRLETWPILKGETYSCSWRYAGGIVADMQEKGDYIDWYCSGIRETPTEEDLKGFNEEQLAYYKQRQAYVGEGFVTDEIKEDLAKLGWIVLDNKDK